MRYLFYTVFVVLTLQVSLEGRAQNLPKDEVLTLHDSLIKGKYEDLDLTSLQGWRFSPNDGPNYANASFNDSDWLIIEEPLNEVKNLPASWKGFGWFRLKVRVGSDLNMKHSLLATSNSGGLEFYINDSLILKRGHPSPIEEKQVLFGSTLDPERVYNWEKGKIYQLAIKYSFHNYENLKPLDYSPSPWRFFIVSAPIESLPKIIATSQGFAIVFASSSILLLLVMILHFFLYKKSKDEKGNFWVCLLSFSLWLPSTLSVLSRTTSLTNFWINSLELLVSNMSIVTAIGLVPLVAHKVLNVRPHIFWRFFPAYPILEFILSFVAPFYWINMEFGIYIKMLALIFSIGGGIVAVRKAKKQNRTDLYFIAVPLLAFPMIFIIGTIIFAGFSVQNITLELLMIFLVVIIIPLGFSVYQARRFLRMHKHLDHIVSERTRDLEKAYKDLETSMNDLKAAQTQLVQQEKLASLGQLTAGIAHEIKNPLNFVTNFSDVCLEMVEEAKTELNAAKTSPIPAGDRNGDFTLLNNLSDILKTIELNLKKILQHGNRADGIVKSMLLHSRGGTGKKEAVDFNSFVKEYVNLFFHGMRASKRPINVTILFDLDEEINKVPLIAEDFSRVILNLCNNAFDAMREHTSDSTFHPVLKVSTKKEENKVLLSIQDNGRGIDPAIADHILQPFFTTKKGTDGTGLGLSLSNEIVKAHGGEIRIESQPGEGANFIVIIPI